jgi:hypothetical protein
METKMNPNDTEATETATAAGICDAAEFARTASTETGGRTRGRLVAGWHFTRHLLEMVVAMVTGMAALGASLWALGVAGRLRQPVRAVRPDGCVYVRADGGVDALPGPRLV